MADIELVIKIDEEQKKMVDAIVELPPQVENDLISAIRHGIPLPKGHGRIGDLDKLIKAMKERDEDNGGEPLNVVDRGYHLAYEHLCEEIDNLLKEKS